MNGHEYEQLKKLNAQLALVEELESLGDGVVIVPPGYHLQLEGQGTEYPGDHVAYREQDVSALKVACEEMSQRAETAERELSAERHLRSVERFRFIQWAALFREENKVIAGLLTKAGAEYRPLNPNLLADKWAKLEISDLDLDAAMAEMVGN